VLGWAFEANVGEVKSQLEGRGRVKVDVFGNESTVVKDLER